VKFLLAAGLDDDFAGGQAMLEGVAGRAGVTFRRDRADG
jgi:hypothetical protein